MYTLYGQKGAGSASAEAALAIIGAPYRLVETASWEPNAAFTELRSTMVPAVAQQLGKTPTEMNSYLHANFPATMKFLEAWDSEMYVGARDLSLSQIRFADEFHMPFPVLLDQKGKVRKSYALRGVPTSVFIDIHGIVRLINPGPITSETIQRGLAEILPAQ